MSNFLNFMGTKYRGTFKEGARQMPFTKENAAYYGRLSRQSSKAHTLTHEDCVKGGKAAYAYLLDNKPWVLLWLKKRIRAFDRARQFESIDAQLAEARLSGMKRVEYSFETLECVTVSDSDLPF
jgi:hypothetical protein